MTIDVEERFLESASSICIIAFASGNQREFNFGRVLANLRLPHVLIRDSATRWYQQGVAGLGNLATVVDYLCAIRRQFYLKTVGLSSGAYAALLYGQLAEADEIIAISPMTGTETDDLDPQWHYRVKPDPDEKDPPQIDDLRKFFVNGSRCKIKAFVSDGEGTELDAHMARRIGVNPILIPGYSHAGLAKGMRDCGLLARLLTERS